MPEYLKNKIDKIKDDAEVWVFEKRHETAYNTIRKRIESIIGEDRIVVWGEKPEDILIKSIKEMNPDLWKKAVDFAKDSVDIPGVELKFLDDDKQIEE